MPSLIMCLRVRLSSFYISLYISFIYKDIIAKFADDVYDYENMPVKILSIFKKTKWLLKPIVPKPLRCSKTCSKNVAACFITFAQNVYV